MLEAFQVSAVIPARPERIYEAWLDSTEHSEFTGGSATIDPVIGGRHTAWNGYIEGTTIELEPGRRIVQTWRSSEFPDDSADSRLEVQFKPHESGTEVTILHSEIPEGQGSNYETGWVDHYFVPMKSYFARAIEAIIGGSPSESGDGGETVNGVPDLAIEALDEIASAIAREAVLFSERMEAPEEKKIPEQVQVPEWMEITRERGRAEKSPAKKAVAKSPVKKAVGKSPVKKAVGKSPVTKAVAKSPAKKAVAKSPVKKAVAKSPVKKAVAKSPVKKAIGKSPVKKAVAKSPVKKAVAKSPAKKAVAKLPAKKAVGKSPARKAKRVAPKVRKR